MRKHLEIVAALGILLVNSPVRAGDKLVIGITDWVGFYPFYLAKEKKLFGALSDSIEVRYYPDPGTGLAETLANKIECTGVTNLEGALAISNRGEITAVLVTDFSNGADMLLAAPGIGSVKDLKGKWVAAEAGSLSHSFFLHILDQNGMTEEDVRFKGVPHQEGNEQFKVGKVDAVVGFPPFLDAEALAKGKVLVSTKEYPTFINDNIWCNSAAIASKKELVQAMVDGWFSAVNEIQTNPKESYKIMAKAISERQKASEIEADAGGIRLGTKELNKEWFSGAQNTMKNLSDFIVKQNLGKKIRDPEKAYITDFVGMSP